MSNMSYCRFRNTLQDFRDCSNNIFDKELNNDEACARFYLISAAKEMVDKLEEFGYSLEEFDPCSPNYAWKEEEDGI